MEHVFYEYKHYMLIIILTFAEPRNHYLVPAMAINTLGTSVIKYNKLITKL